MTALVSRTSRSSKLGLPSAAIDIPFDVCSHIASFLSPEHRRNLYAINHAFFTIAMDERYKNVHLGHDADMEKISRDVSRLKSFILTLNIVSKIDMLAF
jgi:hypothetical protein